MSPLAFPCPMCSGEIHAEEGLFGTTISCPHCSGPIVIPKTETSVKTKPTQLDGPASDAEDSGVIRE